MNPVMLRAKKGNANRRHLALVLLHLDIAPVLTISNAALPELGPHMAVTGGILKNHESLQHCVA